MQSSQHSPNIHVINGKRHDFTGQKVYYYMSAVALWIRFKHQYFTPKPGTENSNTGRKFYMPDLAKDLNQVIYRGMPVELNLQKGIDRAIHLVNDEFSGRFLEARVYLEWQENDITKGNTLFSCKKDESIEQNNFTINPTMPSFKKWKSKREIFIEKNINQSGVIIDLSGNQKIYKRREYHIPF